MPVTSMKEKLVLAPGESKTLKDVTETVKVKPMNPGQRVTISLRNDSENGEKLEVEL